MAIGRTPSTHTSRARTAATATAGRRLRRLTAGAIGTLLVLAVAMLGATSSASGATGSTLTVVSNTQISTFNPFISFSDGELDLIGNVYPTLTMVNEKGESAPYLATSWKTSQDGLTWTFTIHSGLKWTDGQPITANDAAWTFNLIMTNKVAATSNGSLVSNFASVSAPNDTTLIIKTKKPQSNMLYVSVPVSGIAIVPEHIWKSKVANLKAFTNMDFPVVGYGPWILTGNVTNQYATMTANKDFFMGAPKFDTLISRYFTSSDASAAALKSGELTQNGGITSTQYLALKNEKNIKTYQTEPNSWKAIEINSGAKTQSGKPMGTGNPILADPVVRRAIALAIDRKTLVAKVADGLAQTGAGYIPPGYPQWAWKPTAAQDNSYDPAKAKQILDAAGYKVGANGIRTDPKTGKPLSFRLGIHSDTTSDAQTAPYLKGWLNAIGIEVTVEAMSYDQLNANLAKGDWDMLMDGWGTGSDPTYLLSIQTCGTLPLDNGTGGNSDAFYCNPAYDKLYEQQLTQLDPKQRAATIREMQSVLYDANGDVILYYSNGVAALRSDKVENYLFGSENSAGFYPLQNFFINWRQATPVQSGGSSHLGLYIGIPIAAVVVLILVGGFFIWRRRSTSAERE